MYFTSDREASYTVPPEITAAILDYLSLPPCWSMSFRSFQRGFVDLRIHNAKNFYRRTIRIPEAALLDADKDGPEGLIQLMGDQYVAQRLRTGGDERMESPILVHLPDEGSVI